MTVASTTRKAGPYTGNGVATSFAFAFKVFTTADISVVKADSAGTESTLVLDSDYSVTLNADQTANPGGSITYPVSGSPLTAAERLAVLGGVAYNQTTSLPNGGAYNASIVERALDRLTILIQQILEIANRGVRLAATAASNVSGTLPAPAPLALLGWNSAATAIQNFAGVAGVAVSTFMATVVAAVDAMTARTALGATTVGNAIFTAASAAAARSTLGAAASGANTDIASVNGGAYSGLRNVVANGAGRINSISAPTITASLQAMSVDGFYGYVGGGAGMSGTLGTLDVATEPNIFYGFVAASWNSGGNPIWVYNCKAADVRHMRGQTVSLICKVYQDLGSTRNVAIALGKPNGAADDFAGGVTNLAYTSTNVPCATGVVTQVKQTFTLTSADVSKGLQIIIYGGVTAAVATKNYVISELTFMAGDITLPAYLERTPLALDRVLTRGAKAPGEIFEHAGTTAPYGSLVCPVSATNISRTTYADLFAEIGTNWGVGDGSTTFGMPWFAADYASVQANGNVGTQTVGVVINHVHSNTSAAINTNSTPGGGATTAAQTTANTGNPTTGGSANLPAGHRVLKCVQYLR